ncbi:MAG: hypothetical protein A3G30_06210 [Chlamydiae bacterium RIFCSPLOWO2_12_FULL_49_12]|nr:MAG: hypothetical protein A3D18_05565 [Chlamydiae bacterium RIFCSPHIGHO2_02_FULL_49_29]OGN67628.1 MAG: hypothetical protein A3I15_02890 [Chlamydiae bacterium RIFCSPLOWO2_02_FULL_49_12]OGN70921.1 MAG: hypothetical protein A3G30_06210 [Chlamydiae bacterium RIFCSPLOWO2_12_FULL_49_12]HBR18714.1 hypothetical protein [Phycisphaerales bacterium]
MFWRFSSRFILIAVMFLFSSFSLSGKEPWIETSGEFLSSPKILSQEDLRQVLKEQSLDMTWHNEENYFHFVTRQDHVFFEIICTGKLPDCFNDKKDQFISEDCFVNGKNQKRYRYFYQYGDDEETKIGSSSSNESFSPNSFSYIVCERRVIENEKPTIITEEELASIIRNKNVLFYTGAGLSASSNVPTMNQLESLLGIKKGVDFFPALKKAIETPQWFALQIQSFHQACFSSPPTKAHLALKELALFKHCQIVTENLDSLHEQTGIMPYRIDANHLKTEIDSDALREIDAIICIGLSYDDRGFLGWYKKHNPEGKVISIDLSCPSYLGNDDLLLKGDLQTIIPQLKLSRS